MENHDRNDHNHGSGFLLGVVVGGIATLLFTTKKGREILRDITDRGLKKVSEIQNELSADEKLEIIEEENDYLDSSERKSLPSSVENEKKVDEEKEEKNESKTIAASKPSRSVKRLFRIKKN